ncbi:MAG: tRNA (adenosine(37)-N6)-threonylcarbamoyltransferase complex dimerization subunit type 1 TsaB [Nannocystis sp.]|nr:tRNA (adenosine(37)-N6)-threonylcarbamoyltransferase complex dimerization subunit type 1 TsaB [Nannocystis sp.]MBA3546452.1 tRNA (adenosine(37)-N6)-threonylcarbamoyltransferase complex dimerization subunit type 1 TsaB [Nannocystis sp.]
MPAIWLLALDTSTPLTALALGKVDRERASGEMVAGATHDDQASPASSLLAARISALLSEAGITPRDLGALACGVGPGTFTGTRVALATAKGLAFALPCPLFAVPTLAAVAGSAAANGRVLALLDARRAEVYAAEFVLDPAGPRRAGPDRCCSIEQVLLNMVNGPGLQVIGPGVAVHAAALTTAGCVQLQPSAGVEAQGLWRAAALAALEDQPADLAAVDAVYLRPSYAELGTNTPRRAAHRSPFV